MREIHARKIRIARPSLGEELAGGGTIMLEIEYVNGRTETIEVFSPDGPFSMRVDDGTIEYSSTNSD